MPEPFVPPPRASSADVNRSSQPDALPQIDDSHAATSYVNFCRAMGTPEELILDFGLNIQALGLPPEPIVSTHRITVNFYTAKRIMYALHASVERHEAAFGTLELDVEKRVLPTARKP